MFPSWEPLTQKCREHCRYREGSTRHAGQISEELATGVWHLHRQSGVSITAPADWYRVTTFPAGHCHVRHCSFCHKPGVEKGTHGTRAAGSDQETCAGVRDGGWSHVSPAAVVQTDCRPTPEPNAAACCVKNSLPPLPTPSSAGLFLTQYALGAWLTVKPPFHCSHQDENTQRKISNSITELLFTAHTHPACCMKAEDLGRNWQRVQLSTEGHNWVLLWQGKHW